MCIRDSYQSDECVGSKCIQVQTSGIGAVLLIGYSSNFPTSNFEKVQFQARLANASTESEYTKLMVTFDGCTGSVSISNITKQWQTFNATISEMGCGAKIKTIKYILPSANNLLFDEILMIPSSSASYTFTNEVTNPNNPNNPNDPNKPNLGIRQEDALMIGFIIFLLFLALI
eukprot:TRINITY_DN4473_c0_g1_i10.p2 TRINITY_DN4473_c0_g1~~TRINITY_DN4473_c0_g1_i10.p2  ORF type:complete len:173 (+),score=17.83 TRINITY_DN4473_c0_g1_i10:120-638(+)